MANALLSPFVDVSSTAWERFLYVMATSAPDAVSPSNAVGMFELSPKRLCDLGVVRDLRRTRGPSGRMIWIGRFVAPLTCGKVLGDPREQRQLFERSMRDYRNSVHDLPDGMTLSGALAIMHKAGPKGLESWKQGKRFEETEKLFNMANGIF